MDIKLPASGATLATPANDAGARVPTSRASSSASRARTGVVKPVSATWPDAKGAFKLVLPASVEGQTLRFWQVDFESFSAQTAASGGPVDVSKWPKALSVRAARDTAFVKAS